MWTSSAYHGSGGMSSNGSAAAQQQQQQQQPHLRYYTSNHARMHADLVTADTTTTTTTAAAVAPVFHTMPSTSSHLQPCVGSAAGVTGTSLSTAPRTRTSTTTAAAIRQAWQTPHDSTMHAHTAATTTTVTPSPPLRMCAGKDSEDARGVVRSPHAPPPPPLPSSAATVLRVQCATTPTPAATPRNADGRPPYQPTKTTTRRHDGYGAATSVTPRVAAATPMHGAAYRNNATSSSAIPTAAAAAAAAAVASRTRALSATPSGATGVRDHVLTSMCANYLQPQHTTASSASYAATAAHNDNARTRASDARRGSGAATTTTTTTDERWGSGSGGGVHRSNATWQGTHARAYALYGSNAASHNNNNNNDDDAASGRRVGHYNAVMTQTMRRRSSECGSASGTAAAAAATTTMQYTPLLYGTVVKHLIPRGNNNSNSNNNNNGSATASSSGSATVSAATTRIERGSWASGTQTTAASSSSMLLSSSTARASLHLPSAAATTTTTTTAATSTGMYVLRAAPQLQHGQARPTRMAQQARTSSNSATTTTTTADGSSSSSGSSSRGGEVTTSSRPQQQQQQQQQQQMRQKQHLDVHHMSSSDSYSSASATAADDAAQQADRDVAARARSGDDDDDDGGSDAAAVAASAAAAWRRSASGDGSAALLQHIVAEWSYTAEENKATYQQGGYLAVTLGSLLHARYVVLRKLGWGVFSTVWLAHDTQQQQQQQQQQRHDKASLASSSFVAIKIARCEESKRLSALYEVKLLRYLAARLPPRAPVAGLLDSFRVSATYGTHVCMVMPVLGANTLCIVDYMKARPRVRTWQEVRLVKHVVRAVLEGLAALSAVHVLHTDVKPENILCAQPNAKMVELMQRYSQAAGAAATTDGDVGKATQQPHAMSSSSSSSSSLYRNAWSRGMTSDHHTSSTTAVAAAASARDAYTHVAVLADMGLSMVLEPSDGAASASMRSMSPSVQTCLRELLEARTDYRVHTPGVLSNTRGIIIQTREYRAPEVLLGLDFTCATDVWSVGCVAYELLTGRFLMDPKRCTRDERQMDIEHLAMMMQLIGPLPREIAGLRVRRRGTQHRAASRHGRRGTHRSSSNDDDSDRGDGSDSNDDYSSSGCSSSGSSRRGGHCQRQRPRNGHHSPRDRLAYSSKAQRAYTEQAAPHASPSPVYLHRYVDENGNFIYADHYRTYARRQLHKELLPYLGSTEAAMEAASFVLTCLYSYDPRHRPSARSMLAHPWLRDVM